MPVIIWTLNKRQPVAAVARITSHRITDYC